MSPLLDARALDSAQAARERLDQRGDLGREPGGDAQQVRARDRRGNEEVLGVGAVQQLEVAAALVDPRRVRGHDAPLRLDVDPAELVPERARQLAEQHGVAAAERLQVGAVGERDLDPDEHVAGAGLGPRHLLQPQVAGAVEEQSPHGVKTTLSARPERYSSTPSAKLLERKHGRLRHVELREQSSRLLHVPRRRRARAGERQLAPVDGVRVDRPGIREHEHRPTRRDQLERRRRRAQDGRVHRPVRRAAGALRVRVDRVDVVAAPAQHLREEPPDEALADHEHAPAWHALGSPQDAGERLDVGADRVAQPVRNRHAARLADPLREPARHDRRRGESLARRLVSGQAALALAAGQVVDRARAAFRPHPARPPRARAPSRPARNPELLDVRAAQPAGQHAHRRRRGLGHLDEPWLSAFVHHHRAHVRIVGFVGATATASGSARARLRAAGRRDRRDGLRAARWCWSRSAGRSTASRATRCTSGSSASPSSCRCRCSRSRRARSPTGCRGSSSSSSRSRSTPRSRGC